MIGTRMRAAAAALCLGGVLLTGCARTDLPAGTAATSAQSDLPVPVVATATEPSAPQSLSIGGESAAIVAVATDRAGTLLPPQDVHQLGWWADSALPGSGQGTVVVTGHIDDATQGQGYAARFAGLHAGDEVSVNTADGGRVNYRVDRVVTADKSSHDQQTGLPTDELNRLDGPETLALITCGGPFVGPPLGYQDNIVAFASRE